MIGTTSLIWLGTAVVALAAPATDALDAKAGICSGSSFKKVSAADWIKNANPGWNLGGCMGPLTVACGAGLIA